MAHPISQCTMTMGHIAVAVLLFVDSQLVESLLPLLIIWLLFLSTPVESNTI